MPSVPQATTILDTLQRATALLANDSQHARLEAEMLLGQVLGKPRSWLYTWPEHPLDPAQHQAFERVLQRRLAGEPIAHILGRRGFWSLDLQVSTDTLIPRPDTERLVELALERIPPQAAWTIADLGTGSGAIALALAHERPGCQILASDRSLPALLIARQNAARLGLVNLVFVAGDWLAPFSEGPCFEMIVANPPYIPDDDPHLIQGDIRFEPRSALAAGADGLDDLRRIVRQAGRRLKPGGWLLLEHGYDQGPAMMQLLTEFGYQEIEDVTDYGGNPRVALARHGA